MSMGPSSSNQSSTPLTPEQRRALYNEAMGAMGETLGWEKVPTTRTGNGPYFTEGGGKDYKWVTPELTAPAYVDPSAFIGATYTDPGAAKQLSGGDYEALQKAIIDARTIPLGVQEKRLRTQTNEDLAKRGIFTSGAGTAAQNDITERLAPVYSQVVADAVAQRYGLQAEDLRGLNQYNLNSTNMKNTFGLNQAQAQNQYNVETAKNRNLWNADWENKKYESKWRPLDYLQGLWSGTGGNVIVGGSSGWSI